MSTLNTPAEVEPVLPRLTIITVCYNASRVIRRTLESIQSQTYPEIEYLVIDGASKDDTLAQVRTLAPRAVIYSEPDRGIYDAMNKGIAHATGEYLWFINAGDALPDSETAERVMTSACASGQRPGVIYGDTQLIDDGGRILGLRRLRPPMRLTWRSFQEGMLVCHQAFIARRDIAPSYDLSYRFSADVDWCIRVLKRAEATYFYNEPIALYLNEGTTTANHRASLLERFRVMRHHYGLLPTLWQHLRFLLVRVR